MNMLVVDIAVVVPFLAVLFFWTRGVWKQARSDLILSAVVLVAAICVYAYFYRLTMLTNVPCLCLLVCTGAAAIVMAVRWKKAALRKAAAIWLVVALCLAALLYAGEDRWNAASNSLLVIEPYRPASTWVFDDRRAGLQHEPFVRGVPEWIDTLVKKADIPDADKGFRLIFSAQPFPGYQAKVVWRRREMGGNWYYSEELGGEGWLCPALFKYFKRAPKAIYVSAEPK